MTWETWSVFTVTTTALCLTPGPAVLFVVSQGLGRGAMPAFWASVGIIAGNTLYFALSATGLAAVLLASWDLFAAIEWLGAGYLVWLGVRTLVGGSALARVVPAGGREASSRLLARGFLVQAANPKALVFFTAFVPQFVDPALPVASQVAILGITTVVVELPVLAAYGALAARSARLVARPGFAVWTQRAAGLLLVGAGVRMARLGRPS
jgi:homoserine/homoserine lactone efflux protein